MHETVEDRGLCGTWVLAEIRLAIQKIYKVIDISEDYEYQVTQYDPRTCDGGVFVDYINTFLKIEAEASGYPSWVRIPKTKNSILRISMRGKAWV